MAKESVKILQGKLDVKSLIDQLNAALSEEWLAYYQYWIGALVVEGAMRPNVQSEFEEHANEVVCRPIDREIYSETFIKIFRIVIMRQV